MIFRQAIKDKLIKDNPQNGVVVPKKRKTVEEIEKDPIETKYLEREELDDFLKAVREHGLDLDLERFYLLVFSGMRSGELLALKWTDINFKSNEIRITKTLYNENNNMKKYQLTPPKTEGSIRTINVEKEIINLLKSHYRRQSKIKMKYRHELDDYHDGNFVFSRPNGYPFIQKNIITRMNRLLEYTNITKKATPHIFRHTHISMMTEAGIDLATIMEKVGHEDMKATMKIYTHVTNKMKKDASAKVRTLYEDALSNLIS
ncbi:tyrosine-type recombinase/integrase [Virgibacillus pantothenticus]|uniref:tyrosine-type recombinase/integrase n=1 Tax=Virgibacillus pantothenticus TaxID=1473 RepID=UPI0020B23047|nr:site-specific integrase [Virgibacillus pantothenticus]MEB5454217.1 site-specific integrase [Virgibacillus pantothenticus]MEB5458443.1 site-specific integrase [Virgibacillus pantothenticus]MEB5462631.1 site-specific integrase [Virgibacillus pantothenticus]MEB5466807.1 site-specific integrase [Virgibacillus pantothenticus]MEB5471045.1 site-specific integrase [Virgibacillus pantothenticus]